MSITCLFFIFSFQDLIRDQGLQRSDGGEFLVFQRPKFFVHWRFGSLFFSIPRLCVHFLCVFVCVALQDEFLTLLATYLAR